MIHRGDISTTYTFNALIVLPDAIASHSPGPVERPVFMVIPAICGDHAIFVTSPVAAYAMRGSVRTRFLTSGRGEFNRDPALRGEDAGCVWPDKSHRRTWQSSPVQTSTNGKHFDREAGRYTSSSQQGVVYWTPCQSIDLGTVSLEFQHRLSRTSHIQDLYVRAIHMKC
jgi:hypothetical protein